MEELFVAAEEVVKGRCRTQVVLRSPALGQDGASHREYDLSLASQKPLHSTPTRGTTRGTADDGLTGTATAVHVKDSEECNLNDTETSVEMTETPPLAAPGGSVLLKARIKHTRLFLAALAPLVFVTAPYSPQYNLPHEIMEWVGHLLVPLGVSIRVYASLYVGGRKNDDLVTWGPFSIVRNPLYVGSFIATIGLSLLTASVAITALVAVAFAAYYSATVAREEVHLHRKFGVRYRQYLRRVPRWVPGFSLWDSPEELVTKPRFVLRTITDGTLFFLCIPVLEALCDLKSNGTVPSLLTLL